MDGEEGDGRSDFKSSVQRRAHASEDDAYSSTAQSDDDDDDFTDCDDRLVVHLHKSRSSFCDSSDCVQKPACTESTVTRVGAFRPLPGLIGQDSTMQLWEPYLCVALVDVTSTCVCKP